MSLPPLSFKNYVVFRSGTKGDLNRRRCKQLANLLLDVIEESAPSVHLSKSERANIFDSFKDLYQEYWAKSQGSLVMVPAMDTAELTLIILSYAQHLAGVPNLAQKTSEENAWSLVQSQTELKTRIEEISLLKKQAAKKTPSSEETLTPLLEHAQLA